MQLNKKNFMENIKKTDPNEEPLNSVNPKDRDFQRTEEDIDDVSKSEKEELERRKERVHEGSTKPDKNHVGG